MSAQAQDIDPTKELWSWFTEHVDETAMLMRDSKADKKSLITEIGTMVDKLQCGGWEIGPWGDGWFFALSPGGSAEHLAMTRKAIESSPSLEGWTFLPAKPPKDLVGRHITYDGASVDIHAWNYQLRRFGDGSFGLICRTPSDYGLDESGLQRLGWTVLVGELGDATVTDRFVDMEMIVTDAGPMPGNRFEHLRPHWLQLTGHVEPRPPLPGTTIVEQQSHALGPDSELIESIWVETTAGERARLLQAGSRIPSEGTIRFEADRDEQGGLMTRVLRMGDDERDLGRFRVSGFEPTSRNRVDIELRIVVRSDTISLSAFDWTHEKPRPVTPASK